MNFNLKSKYLITILFFIIVGTVFSQTVYVTKTGTKYHTEGCKYLKKSKYSMELAAAKSSGYEACSICKPSSIAKSGTVSPSKSGTPAAQSQSKSASVQCSATTKAGTRCKRMTTSTNGKCYQHGG